MSWSGTKLSTNIVKETSFGDDLISPWRGKTKQHLSRGQAKIVMLYAVPTLEAFRVLLAKTAFFICLPFRHECRSRAINCYVLPLRSARLCRIFAKG